VAKKILRLKIFVIKHLKQFMAGLLSYIHGMNNKK